MGAYIAVITTVLAITQIIRITQSSIALHKQNTLFDKICVVIRDDEEIKADLETQRKAYKLIVEYLDCNEKGEQGYLG